MSTRLNDGIRNQILKALISNKFEKEEKALSKKKIEFGDEVYKAMYSPKERERINKLPEGWLPTNSGVRVNFAGNSFYVNFSSTRRFLQRNNSYIACNFSTNEPIFSEWKELQKIEDDLVKRRGDARQAAKSMLHSVSTIEKLKKVWPECIPFIPAEFKPITTALAIPIPQLNEMLGLK